MSPSTPRTVAPPLIFARASPPIFTKARGHNPYARAGLAFERKVGPALAAVASDAGASLDLNPWFTFRDAAGDGACSPDAILNCGRYAIVIEIKLKYVLGAEAKLRGLYVPIVARARDTHITNVFPLIITKILTPDARDITVETVFDAIQRTPLRAPVLHWLGTGRIRWEPQHAAIDTIAV